MLWGYPHLREPPMSVETYQNQWRFGVYDEQVFENQWHVVPLIIDDDKNQDNDEDEDGDDE